MLRWASVGDSGFDRRVFAEMLASLDRLTDEDLPVHASQAAALRAFYREWDDKLTG
ncbi:MAG TPA: hypothetical protein VFQ44_04080 [Streptosporangiaceae bacterium]|nr:hypothetical protein [Streptosporangiaceae bacterium]